MKLFVGFNSCQCLYFHALFFFVADAHMLILYICYSNCRVKSSLELMFYVICLADSK